VALPLLGGFARTDRLRVALVGAREPVAQWPANARADRPESFGRLVVAPLYPRTARAGSVFVDGGDGEVVLPDESRLVGRRLTIAAWVRVVGSDCGPLISGGSKRSLWIQLCGSVRVSRAGEATLDASRPLGDGWHHVAVTVDSRSLRTIYIDGVRDRGDIVSEKVPARQPDVGPSRAPLLVGADSDSSGPDSRLHGYVRELAIWSRALSPVEIHRVALRPESVRSGAVAFWPFTRDLRDEVGRHDAGLVGAASLARDQPRGRRLGPAPRTVRLRVRPRPLPRPAFNRLLATDAIAPRLDGWCGGNEYRGASDLSLEPTRTLSIRALVSGAALYVCVPPQPGDLGDEGVSVWLAVDGRSRVRPGPNDLRIRLLPDGSAQVDGGSGRYFVSRGLAGLAARGHQGRVFPEVDDSPRIASPWWTAEARIPLGRQLRPGARLRLAVRYRGSMRPGALLAAPARTSEGQWPLRFDEVQPRSWGEVHIVSIAARAAAPALSGRAGASAAGRPASASAFAGGLPAWPPGPPLPFGFATTFDHFSACPADLSVYPKWYFGPPEYKWPQVTTTPYRRFEGTVEGIEVSWEDSYAIHNSHDVDIYASPIGVDSRNLIINRGEAFKGTYSIDGGPTTPFFLPAVTHLVLETESLGLPPNVDSDVQARPRIGDHITAIGKWIFDCGHEPHTELHPVFALESDGVHRVRVRADGPLRTVTRARVWFNGSPDKYAFLRDPTPFSLLDSTYSYRFGTPVQFSIRLPSAGRLPFLRIVRGDPARVHLVGSAGDALQVSVTPAPGYGRELFEFDVGFLDQLYVPKAGTYAVHFDHLDVKDDTDSSGDGEWFFAVKIDGLWRQVLWNSNVNDSVKSPGYDLHGCTKGLCLNVPPLTVTDDNPTIGVNGYDDDSPCVCSDDKLDRADSVIAGTLVGKHVLETANWALSYHITKVPSEKPVLADAPFWTERLRDEPNDGTASDFCLFYADACHATDLGAGKPVHVPSGIEAAPDELPTVAVHRGYVTEAGLDHRDAASGDSTRLIGRDTDVHSVTFDDLADVSFGTLPLALRPLQLGTTVTKQWPHYDDAEVPACVQNTVGWAGARMVVASKTGAAGDIPYDLRVQARAHHLPSDWGEEADGDGPVTEHDPCTPEEAPRPGHPGRKVDIAGDPGGEIDDMGEYPERVLQLPWAWQHRNGDVDLYEIEVPPIARRPFGQKPCVYDKEVAELSLSAPGMRLTASGTATGSALDRLQFDEPPGGTSFMLRIAHPTGHRGLYRLTARFADAFFFNPKECAARKAVLRPPPTPLPVTIEDLMHWHGPVSDPPGFFELRLFGRSGGFLPMILEAGDRIDAILSAPAGEALAARLYDGDGVLRAETHAVSLSAMIPGNVPDGLTAQGSLAAGGLRNGEALFLQIVALNRRSSVAPTTGSFAFTAVPARQ
jgi:hypothetical protein